MEPPFSQITSTQESRGPIAIGKLSLCFETHTLIIKNRKHHLRNKLFKLLKMLSENSNRLIPRDELIELIWDNNHYIGEKGLTHAVCMLRNLIKKDQDCGVSIETIPKTGYRLKIKKHYSDNPVGSKAEQQDEEWRKVDTSTPGWWPNSSSLFGH